MASRLSLVGLLFSLIACRATSEKASRVATLPYYEESSFTPCWYPSPDSIPDDFHQIPAFNLTNQAGQAITRKDVEEKIYVVDFFFTTCPGICPKLTSNMAIVQKEFMQDDAVLLLSHSVTPEHDSVSVLKRYAEDKGVVEGKWHLLTGDRQQIYDLGRNQYFVEEDLGVEKGTDGFLHTENFVLVDPHGYIRGIYNGLNKTAVNQLVTDIKTLKKEREAS